VRIVSLLPAATEIVAALGRLDDLVGVSHECDYPEAVTEKPRVTACQIQAGAASGEIDRWVGERLARGEELFTLDEPLLRELRPELILTQRLCDVCAPAYGSVAALAQGLPGPPRVVNLEPSSLEDIFANIATVAAVIGATVAGQALLQSLHDRVEFVRQAASAAAHAPRVAVLEWLDPPFASGHWTPELVALAGGTEMLGKAREDSARKSWDEVARCQLELLIIACCGQTAARAGRDWEVVRGLPQVQSIPAVRAGNVWIADGNAYFSRPGPRVVDALEIVAEILHPEIFAGMFPDRGVVRSK
jgi:iron complex transport system substrate-binding protein